MSERTYSVILEWDAEGGMYVVTVPALPGCFTQGHTAEEAIERAKEAIALHLECLIEDGEPVPEETRPAQVVTVTVAA